MPMHNTDTSGSDAAKFYGDIANGLHAMAQPLTILRASMEVLSLPPSAGIDQRRYMEISAAQLERTCTLFTRVQDLVTARFVEAERSRYEVWEIIAPLIEARKQLLQAAGAGIAVASQGPWQPVVGDLHRTEQAVTAVLQIAGEMAERGDVIEISAAPHAGFLEITIENTRKQKKSIGSAARLNLALAEENVLSQQGRYELTREPFKVLLALPIEDPGPSHRQTAALH
jgi:hypothetical protein